MKDLAFLTSPDMSKAEVVTNHVVIAEYAGIERNQFADLSIIIKMILKILVG